MAAVRSGRLRRLTLILRASPAVLEIDFAGAFLAAVMLAGTGRQDEAIQAMSVAAGQASVSQALAGADRLAAFATGDPEHAEAARALGDILRSPRPGARS